MKVKFSRRVTFVDESELGPFYNRELEMHILPNGVLHGKYIIKQHGKPSESFWVDGELHGLETIYHDAGEETIEWRHGIKHGLRKFIGEWGDIEEVVYVNGKREGWEISDDAYDRITKTHYENDRKNGISYMLYEGKISDIRQYQDDMISGLFICLNCYSWYKDGKLDGVSYTVEDNVIYEQVYRRGYLISPKRPSKMTAVEINQMIADTYSSILSQLPDAESLSIEQLQIGNQRAD